MGIATFIVYKMFVVALHSNAIATIIAILVAMVVYFVVMLLLGGITREELNRVPHGDKLIRLAEKMHLLK